jgi:hypothetical protein
MISRLFPIRFDPRVPVTPRWAWLRAAIGQRVTGQALTYRPEQHYMRGPGPACAAKRRNPPDAINPG